MTRVPELQLPTWARTVDGVVREWCDNPFGDPFGNDEARAYGHSLRLALRTDRLITLFGCACVRPCLYTISGTRTLAAARRVLDAAERLVDGELPLDDAYNALDFSVAAGGDPISYAVGCVTGMWFDDDGEDVPQFIPPSRRRYRVTEARPLLMGELVARAAASCANLVSREAEARQLSQGRMLACVVGPGWTWRPEWRTDTTVSLARGIYTRRDFGAMPILADALEEAGCDNEWLGIMRDQSWSWCRGCRIIDDLRADCV
jgi:hypothetical protein